MHGSEILVPIAALIGLFSVPVSSICLYWWYEIRKVSCEAAIKRDMIARGYSAKEIVFVLTNGKKVTDDAALSAPPAKSISAPAYH